MPENSIMVFGCGELQTSIIMQSRQIGLEVVGVDLFDSPTAKNACNYFYVIPGDDFNGHCAIIERHKIKGIITAATDKPLIMMAMLAEKYHFAFPSLDSIRKSTYKDLLKNELVRNNISTARFYLIEEPDILDLNIPEKFPYIVKPADSSGSRGVLLCRNRKELKHGIEVAMNYSRLKKVLVEEYIPGEEYSVESLVFKRSVYVIQITRKFTTPPPYNVELGHLQPADIEPATALAIHEMITKIVEALDLNYCACHTELKISEGKIYIIENGARLGGDYITSALTPLSSGINIEKELINIAIGKPFNFPTPQNKASFIRYFNLPVGTINYDRYKMLNFKHPALIELKLDLAPGQKVPLITDSLQRYGYILIKADNVSMAENLMNDIYNQILEFIQID